MVDARLDWIRMLSSGPMKIFLPVDMRMEVYALFLDFSQVCQRKYLESAGIGQHRTIPVHKLVKASHFFHDLISGTHVQMVRVAQLHLGADALQIDGRHRTLDSCRCSPHS